MRPYLLEGKTDNICNGQPLYPYAFMKAKVPTFILIYSASVFLLLALSWRCRSRHVHCGPQWQKVLICE